jgi:hypothetical protein
MIRRPFLLALAALLGATPAMARTLANPDGRAVLGLSGARQAPTAAERRASPVRVATPAAIQANPAPMAAGAVVLDSTWYDLQDMGTLGTRVVVGDDGRVHVTYLKDFCELGGGCPPNLSAPEPYPNRAMGYAVRDLGVWQVKGKVQDPRLRGCCVTDLLGGFGSIALTPGGLPVVAQHMDEDGCDLRADFYLADSASAATWSGYLSPIVSPSNLFPQVTANPNGSFTLMGEVPEGGSYAETNSFAVCYLAAAGAKFVCPTGWQLGNWTSIAPASLFRDGKPAFPGMAVSSNGRVGVAVGDFGGNVYLIESTNGSFAPGTITIRNLTNYSDATILKGDSTSTQYRSYVNCGIAYNDTTPHVVWSELQARKIGTSIEYFDYHSRIVHWDSVHGIEIVKQVAAGEADTYDDVDNGLSGPLAGFNTLAVDWPQVGFSSDGAETYVAFLTFSDAHVDPTANMGLPGIVTGIGFGDIAVSVRGGGGWSAPQNVTNTPNTDERFFSLAPRNPGGRAHIVYQSSATDQAGCVIIGDRGTSPGNIIRRIGYIEPHLNASTLAVGPGTSALARSALRVSPNPARGVVRFAWSAWRPAGQPLRLEVISVDGRRVAGLVLDPSGAASWDGRDADGKPAPAGMYFVRPTEVPGAIPARFTLLH